MKNTTIQIIVIILLVIVLGIIVFAGQQTDNGNDADQGEDQQIRSDLGKETITLGLPPWPGATVKSHVVAQVLEEMGYQTRLRELDAGIVYTSLGDKQIDVTVAGWLPTTHQDYWNEVGDNLEIAGINVTQTWLGLGVPSHTDEDIQSLEDLQGDSEFGESVDYTITGIEPGAGIMANTETAIEAYGLSNWTLQQSSAAAMLTALQEAFEDEEPIVTTVWQPHSAFAIGDIRKLDDPQNIYNDPDATRLFLTENAPTYADAEVSSDVLASVVYSGFAQDAPAAYAFFQNFNVPSETQSEWIYQYSVENVSAEEIAQNWIEENRKTVDGWIPEEE